MNERELSKPPWRFLILRPGRPIWIRRVPAIRNLRGRSGRLLESTRIAGEFLSTPAVPPMPADGHGQSRALNRSGFRFRGIRTDARLLRTNPQATTTKSRSDFCRRPTKPGSLGRLGHYEVHEVLGHGAFGIVLKAFDEKLHRMVAIKVMSPELAATSPPRKRFLREARAAAAIRHENVVAVYAVEEQPIAVPGDGIHPRPDAGSGARTNTARSTCRMSCGSASRSPAV